MSTVVQNLETRDVAFLVPVVCPLCKGQIRKCGDAIVCLECAAPFGFEQHFPNLVVGGRFADALTEDEMLYEEQVSISTTTDYFVPLFRRLWPKGVEKRRLLSLGCGGGADVEMLQAAGFDCVGIDNGNRPSMWPRRNVKNSLLLANGKHLPFQDETFDGVFCGCVFPHVGVIGDTYKVIAQFHDDRSRLAREIIRVLRPGGTMVASSPNRLFPFDLFHGRQAGCYVPRPYWFGDPFLLSVGDYRNVLRGAGFTRVEAQPVSGYWRFQRSRNSFKGRLLAMPIRFLFWLVSQKPLRFLRGSPLTPWIVVLAEKGHP